MIPVLALLGALTLSEPGPANPTLVIKNGRIADGAGGPILNGKVILVTGDTITEILEGKSYHPTPGALVIDAKLAIVAPGFIDMHSHADDQILKEPDASTQVRQGITTSLGGQDGSCQCPLAEFFQEVDKGGTAINLASMAGFGTLRTNVMGEDTRRPARPDEISKMKELLEVELRAGAFGLSTGLEYEPDSFATTDELVAVASVVRPHGGFYVSHVRDEGLHVIESYRELLEIAERAGIPAQISHMKLGSRSSWGRFPEYAALMKEADAKGLRITGDCYPYDFWHTTLRALVLSRRYGDPMEVRRGVDDNGGPENLLVSRYAPNPSYEGKSLAKIAKENGTDAYALYMDMVRETEPKNRKAEWGDDVEGVLGKSMQEEDIRSFYRDPRVMVSTDGRIDGSHPRGAGTYPRFLARYVRDARVVTLQEGVRKMTGLPASVLGLRDRGRIAPGMKADLVVFDPMAVVDRSTIQEPTAPPTGISWVVINGQVALANGAPTPVRAGRVLRASDRR
jgi:N-acyl-D-amino-acid deacylase